MYCPQCSQQQVSDEVRFCPRCGFQLDALRLLPADSHIVKAETGVGPQSRAANDRKRDALLGATAMLAGAVTVAVLTVSTTAGTPLQAVIIPLVLVWAAIVALLLLSGHAAREVKKLFSKDASAPQTDSSAGLLRQLGNAARERALPPVQSAPASAPGSWRMDTADLAQPTSVTDRTTDLLNNK